MYEQIYRSAPKKSFLTRKENSLDYYISRKSFKANGKRFLGEKDNEKIVPDDNTKKYSFLKNNVKASKIIPEKMKKVKPAPDNYGNFETPFGTLSIGNKKYQKNSPLVFTIVPEEIKEKEKLPNQKLSSKKTYFGGEKSKKRFKAGQISFMYDPKTKEIKKLFEDGDGVADKQTELLYQDAREEKELEGLENKRLNRGTNYNALTKEINKIEKIKDEKKEDNLKFLKEIRKFVESFEKRRLNEVIESDEALARRKRILELSGKPNLDLLSVEELKEMLERLKKEDLNQDSRKINLETETLTKEQLKKKVVELLKAHSR